MIHIFFVPGMFGTTVEYVLRSFTEEYQAIIADPLSDGSMHSFIKEAHPRSITMVREIFKSGQLTSGSITTPIYPMVDGHLLDILKEFQIQDSNGKYLIIYSDSEKFAEINFLFQYYKIIIGKPNAKLNILFDHRISNASKWGDSYTHWDQMQHWELREWLSIFYAQWIKEWQINPATFIQDALCITNESIMSNPVKTFSKIIDYFGLTKKDGLEDFCKNWIIKQQYVVDEYELIESIVKHTINNQDFKWNETLNIVSEAMVQHKLRANGYEIKCFDLNVFPKDSKTLYTLLEKC
jgi:hypothetical protein